MDINHIEYIKHPWHGVGIGANAPEYVTAFIEITPNDTIKYELDKHSGLLKVDRPQLYSNRVPALYGFIPKTYCSTHISDLANQRGALSKAGDLDPLDILVLNSHNIINGNIILQAKPIGGLCLIDKGEADDKIIAILKGDSQYDHVQDISDLSSAELDRIKHYFLTYKNLPDQKSSIAIHSTYNRDDAFHVIHAAMKDYEAYILTLADK